MQNLCVFCLDSLVPLSLATTAATACREGLTPLRRCRHILRILNPTVPVDVALEDCRESESGYGPQRLSTLAAYSLRMGLLAWLHDAQVWRQLSRSSSVQREGL